MEPPRRTDDGASANRQSGAKRLKIDVACDNCRAKKVKCDGVRPGGEGTKAKTLQSVAPVVGNWP
ncbi:hypothetical protein LB504_005494 [Fusarium proliferatum]|nr:hypothetical protein LB504_005494 [Fusarium proliferatum]